MFRKPGHHIGDTWYFVQGDEVHMFYLTCLLDVPRHTRWSIAHAVSTDLVEWKDLGVILEPGEPGAWDGICAATGSVIAFRGQYYMAYTGNFAGPTPAVGIAVSQNLDTWRKLPANPVTGIDGIEYSAAPNLAWRQPRWRDPFLFQEHGKVYQLVTAAKPGGPPEADGTIALAVSSDLARWEILPPLDVPELAQDLECPKLARIGQRYYLTISISDSIAGPELRSRQPRGARLATAYSLVADHLAGPYVMHGTGRILDDTPSGTPYACEPVAFKERYFLLGTVWNDDGLDAVCDPIPIQATETGFRAQPRDR